MNIFMWTHESDGSAVGDEAMLVVVVGSVDNGGMYKCVVGNSAGNESAEVILNGKKVLWKYLLR